MSYKISFILSMVFVAMYFMFAGDMISLQFIYSDLDAKSVTISYLISENGTIDKPFVKRIEQKYHPDHDIQCGCTEDHRSQAAGLYGQSG